MKKAFYLLILGLFVSLTSISGTAMAVDSDYPGDECEGPHYCDEDDRNDENIDDEAGEREREGRGDEDDGPDGTGGYDPYIFDPQQIIFQRGF